MGVAPGCTLSSDGRTVVNLCFSSQTSFLKVTLLFTKLYIGKQHQNRDLGVHLGFTISHLF